jgi:hypothetical protein
VDPAALRGKAAAQVGDFARVSNVDGHAWTVDMRGVGMRSIRAVLKDGNGFEFGEQLVPGRPPVRILEMQLKRLGDTDGPSAGATGSG